jgi:hypothetical protein
MKLTLEKVEFSEKDMKVVRTLVDRLVEHKFYGTFTMVHELGEHIHFLLYDLKNEKSFLLTIDKADYYDEKLHDILLQISEDGYE